MKQAFLGLVLLAGGLVSLPALAGGFAASYPGYWRPAPVRHAYRAPRPFVYAPAPVFVPRYVPPLRHYPYRGFRAAGAGFALGYALGAWSPPATVVERRVVTRPGPRVYAGSAPSVEVIDPAPPAVGYRRARDGTCWLVEARPDGSTSALPQPPEYCD